MKKVKYTLAGSLTPEEAALLTTRPKLTKKLIKRLNSIDCVGKSLEEFRKQTKGLHIDYLAALRMNGRISLGQYASTMALQTPWMDILEP